MSYVVDYFYHWEHRRLRNKFKMETIKRHEIKIQLALEKGHNNNGRLFKKKLEVFHE